MRKLFTFLICILLISISSCRKDFDTIPSFGNLTFSKDTVFLDTVFTNIGSSTYNLKVYNKSDNAITIPSISLENGTTSNYRISVDGIAAKDFQNIDILAKDSIFIFVETTIDYASVSNPLYTDKILFDTGNNQQDVDLVTLVQDAHFIYPGRNPFSMKIDSLTLDGKPTSIQGRFLADSELTFTNTKPYVIYGYAAIPENKTAMIEAGAKLYFHSNSGIIVDKKGSLKVNGTINNKVVFEGDRLEHRFNDVPGQWGTIWIREGSINNSINHAIIKNGIIGLLIDGNESSTITPQMNYQVEIRNSEIYNHSNFGVLTRQASVNAYNIVVGSAGMASLACTGGGNYLFSYSTFANYWNNGVRPLPAVLINNFFSSTDQNEQTIIDPKGLFKADFSSCIIHGNNNIEFIADRVEGAVFNFNMKHSLIKFNDVDATFTGVPEMDFTNTALYLNNVINGFPHFKDISNNNFIIGQNSDAIGIGFPFLFGNIEDILGVIRRPTYDAGAYQHITFQ